MHTLQKLIKTTGNGILAFVSGHVKNNKTPMPHKHEWEFQYSIGAYWDASSYEVMKCKTCGSEGRKWRGKTKATKRTELCLSLPHEHDWCFEYHGGRKAGADKNTPMSEVVSCECGKWAVRHYGEKEYNLLADTK